jgi:hypothetical protein
MRQAIIVIAALLLLVGGSAHAGPFDVTVTETVSPGHAAPGDNVTISFAATANVDQTGLELDFYLGPNWKLTSGPPSGCSKPNDYDLVCPVGDLAQGSSTPTYSATASPDAGDQPGSGLESRVLANSSSGNVGSAAGHITVDAPPPPPPPPPRNTATLSVTLAGAGSGSVSSAPDGIACGTVCSADWLIGTSVTLTATPGVGSSFAGWSGACSAAAAASTCVVSLAANAAVTASFGPAAATTTSITTTTTPDVAVVPQLVGLKLPTAITRLARSRCRLGTVTKRRVRAALVGKVLAQRPEAGQYVDLGKKIALVVGRR